MPEQSTYKMYQLDPAPQQRTPQECIERYLETGDAGFFVQFLHWHEPEINKKAKKFEQQYAVQGHFDPFNPCQEKTTCFHMSFFLFIFTSISFSAKMYL